MLRGASTQPGAQPRYSVHGPVDAGEAVRLAGFRGRMALHVEALNRALVNVPAEKARMHLCWGNYPGPHHCDVPLADIIDGKPAVQT